MKNATTAEFHELYLQLKSNIDEFINETITADQLKAFAAPFGIYEQRNGLFMIRIRVSGGHITLDNLRDIAALMGKNNIPYAHLSTRQDIQLQDVQAGNIFSTIEDCDLNGLPFKGGGGNTYRNISASPDSGFGPGQVFDVMPYVNKLNSFLRHYEKAFKLPRKLKIGFFANRQETLNAAVQDLGFIAEVKDGRNGFKVYGGGGMGRESSLGVLLFEFLPEDQFIRCAVAMTDLFYDHGDRTNRSKARIRFILQKIGSEEFKKLFQEYYSQTLAYESRLHQCAEYAVPAISAPPEKPADGFELWEKYAVLPTGISPEICSVRLYVPYGNLNAAQLAGIVRLAEKTGCGFLRLTPAQDILLPLVHISNLPQIFNSLLNDFPETDLTLKSFKGHIVSCVGAGVCKIGILNSPAIADTISVEMDKMLPPDTPEKIEILKILTDHLRISGCPNSCAGHPAAKIGLQGQKKRMDSEKAEDVCLLFTGLSTDENALKLSSPPNDNAFIKTAELPLEIREMLSAERKFPVTL